MKPYARLTELIPRMLARDTTPKEISTFFEFCLKISKSYLNYLEYTGRKIRDNVRTLETEQVAFDCISDLFARNDNNEFILLQRYFQPKLVEHCTNTELLILLRKLIIKRTKQGLSRVFKDRDPESAKIIHNIRVAIKNSKDLSISRRRKSEYIHFASMPPMDKERDEFEHYTLYPRYAALVKLKEPTVAVVRKLLREIQSEKDHPNYLHMNLLVRVIKLRRLHAVRGLVFSQIGRQTTWDDLCAEEIRQRHEKILLELREIISGTYVMPGKISPARGEIYAKVVGDIIEEIAAYGEIKSYRSYLDVYIPGLTTAEYREVHRPVMEYLGRVLQRRLKKDFKEWNEN